MVGQSRALARQPCRVSSATRVRPIPRGSCCAPKRHRASVGASTRASSRAGGRHAHSCGSNGSSQATCIAGWISAAAHRVAWLQARSPSPARPTGALAQVVQDGGMATAAVGLHLGGAVHLRALPACRSEPRPGGRPHRAASWRPRAVLRPGQSAMPLCHLPQPLQAARGAGRHGGHGRAAAWPLNGGWVESPGGCRP